MCGRRFRQAEAPAFSNQLKVSGFPSPRFSSLSGIAPKLCQARLLRCSFSPTSPAVPSVPQGIVRVRPDPETPAGTAPPGDRAHSAGRDWQVSAKSPRLAGSLPSSRSNYWPCSITRIRRTIRWSPIRCSTNRIIQSCSILSKNDLMSRSSTTFQPVWPALPTPRPARVNVLLSQQPSLHSLLRPSLAFVRLLRW